MDSSTQDRHEGGTAATQRIVPSPHSARSFSPPSLSSLPTEILTSILEEIPRHPSKDRSASLSRNCLVNKFFLSIARPLLYHKIHLDPDIHRDKTTSTFSQLLTTLLFAPPYAGLVRSITITLAINGGDIDWILLRSVLRQCTMLENLSTGWDVWEGRELDVEKLCEVISKEATAIRRLKIPNVKLLLPSARLLSQTLHQLESLVFKPAVLSDDILPKFNLRQVAWINKLPYRALKTYLPSSSHSLTNLSFMVDYNDPPMLDMFPNLSTLRLALGKFDAVRPDHTSQSRHEENCIEAVRSILLSSHSLSISHLVLSTKHLETAQTLAEFSLVDSLPHSIVILAVVPQLLGIVNLPGLLPTDQLNPYPALRQLILIPPLFTDLVSERTHELMQTTLRQVARVFQRRRTELTVELGVKLGERYRFSDLLSV